MSHCFSDKYKNLFISNGFFITDQYEHHLLEPTITFHLKHNDWGERFEVTGRKGKLKEFIPFLLSNEPTVFISLDFNDVYIDIRADDSGNISCAAYLVLGFFDRPALNFFEFIDKIKEQYSYTASVMMKNLDMFVPG